MLGAPLDPGVGFDVHDPPHPHFLLSTVKNGPPSSFLGLSFQVKAANILIYLLLSSLEYCKTYSILPLNF